MKHLKMWQKLAVMTVIFMIPFAVVTYHLTAAITDDIEFADLELRGLEYYGPVLTLTANLQLHRGVANASLHGDRSFDAALAASAASIEKSLQEIDEIDRRLGPRLNLSARWSAVRAACAELLKSSATLSADESFARHSSAITDAIHLAGDVTSASNLAVDRDNMRQRLIDVLAFQGPELGEALARARGFGVGVIGAKTKTPEQIERLSRDAVLVEFLGAKVDDLMARTIASSPAATASLQGPVKAASDAVTRATAAIVNLTRDGAPVTREAYFATLSRAVDAIQGLEKGIGTALEVSLNDRIAAHRSELWQTLAWTAAGLTIALGLGFLIMRDITVTLRRVVDMANRIATGDLSLPETSIARADEIGVLARAFDGMVSALKDTVGVAERIASGDLSVTVRPRSSRDVLGNALANMVERLSSLVSDVQQSGLQVNTSVNQIAATAKQQQATASEVAATTTEISATSKEIAATSRELVKTMTEVAAVADHSATLAGSGQSGLSRMEETMRHVMDAAGSINAKLAILNEKAGGITQVVTTITKVADQTNLLSLNAAIEAEKAGEYGRGFAVVATEIRRLADQTAVATYDIEQMVREIQAAVSAGVMGMDKFAEEVRLGMREIQQVGDQLSQIIQQVQTLAPRFEAVSEGVEAQAASAEQITQALSQLGDAVIQTVESLRESNQVIDGLNQAATGMRSGVSRFKVAA